MRAAPAVSVAVEPEPGWCRFVAGLTTTAVLTAVGWWIYRVGHGIGSVFAWNNLMPALLLAITLIAAVQALRLRASPACRLEWDGQDWRIARPAAPASIGQLGVVIDLGAWMLLRFSGTAPAGPHPTWIAVAERQMPHQWHALRCAVHGQRTRSAEGAPERQPTDER